MLKDKERWNYKYENFPMPSHVSKILKNHIGHAKVGRALDIASGPGRNSMFLAEQGFKVDAVDISDTALSYLENRENIRAVCADLDVYELEEGYDLIINCNFLDRALITQIKKALNIDGIILFETFVEANGEEFHMPSNESYHLHVNELLEMFRDFEVICYEEKVDINLRGEKVKIASLVARKK
ncbi:MAG: methyltransferase domain-containing protein [Campylobacterota bacterium]|nr:methyltransferase domain-containing protein [Campylobacterota bacterium]